MGIGDGWLEADGRPIYAAKDLRVGLFKVEEAPDRRLIGQRSPRSLRTRAALRPQRSGNAGHGRRRMLWMPEA